MLKKDLQNNKLTYEEIQTVLLEIEMIINNKPLTHLYLDATKTPLTPNYLVFSSMLNHSSSNDRSINNQVLVEGEIYSKPKRASIHKTKAIKYPDHKAQGSSTCS